MLKLIVLFLLIISCAKETTGEKSGANGLASPAAMEQAQSEVKTMNQNLSESYKVEPAEVQTLEDEKLLTEDEKEALASVISE